MKHLAFILVATALLSPAFAGEPKGAAKPHSGHGSTTAKPSSKPSPKKPHKPVKKHPKKHAKPSQEDDIDHGVPC